jgi:hypothetical protein
LIVVSFAPASEGATMEGSMSNYAWLTPVLIAAVIVFFVDVIVRLNNGVLDALLHAVLFAAIAGLIAAYFTVGETTITPMSP